MGDGLGTGKSRVIAEFLKHARPRRTLILCPKSVIGVWPSELAKVGLDDDGFTLALDHGSVALRRDMVRQHLTRWHVVICNYEAVWRAPLIDELLKTKWDMVVLDESHRIKSPSGKASRFAHRLKAARRVCLTGTPMPHSKLDIFSQYKFLDDSIYGTSFTRFKSRYAIMGGYTVNGRSVQITGWREEEDFNRKYHSIAHRVRKDDVLDLPDRVHQEILVDLSPRAARLYAQMRDEFVTELEAGTVTAANAGVRVIRLQQLASGVAKLTTGGAAVVDTAKRSALIDILKDVDGHRPVVVFAHFHTDLDQIKYAAESVGRPCVELSGRVNEVGHKWEVPPGPAAPVAAVQIQAGGTGIDLTAASTCIYFSQTYNLGAYDQSLARVHRPGQHHKVNYIHLLARDTVDQTIRRALSRRQDSIAAIVDQFTQGRTTCQNPVSSR